MPITPIATNMAIIAALADLPNATSGLTAAQLKAKFDEGGTALKTYINGTLIPALESTTDGTSGADQIRATAVSGLTGTSVQALIESLKTYADSLSMGAIPDESLTNIKHDPAEVYKLGYAADAGSSDAYAITLSPAPTAYYAGMTVRFKANTLNTGAATLNINALGAIPIAKSYNSPMETGDILANQIVEVVYDGTNFQLIGEKLVPRARVSNNAVQSIANNTLTALSFNSETYDTDVIHDNATNSSRLTCKTAGVYQIIANVTFASNATGYRRVLLHFNGGGDIAEVIVSAVSGVTTSISATSDYLLAVNDYVEVKVQQNSGGALDVNAGSNTTFSMRKVA